MIAAKLGRVLTPWQRDVVDVALERIDGPGSPWAYDQIVTIVGRRSGKTVTSLGVSLVRALAGPLTLASGKRVPFRAAHTAQNLIAARKRFLSDLVDPYSDSMDEARWKSGHQVLRNLANTTLTIDPKGASWRTHDASEIQVYAPTVAGVRGDGLLHLTLDEALVLSLDEGGVLMAAARPTMAEFGGHAQQWITTNISAETDETRWISAIRDKGRAAVAADRRTGVAYFEFSMPPDGDPGDETLWWAHLPALGDGIVNVDVLRRDYEELGPARFGAEYLGLWPGQAAVRGWAAIPASVWDAASTDEPAPENAPVRAFGIDLDPFGRASSIVAATGAEGDPVRLEVVAHATGSDWVLDTVRALAAEHKDAVLVVDDYGAGHELLLTLERDGGLPLHPMTTRDASSACYAFETAIGARTTRFWPNDDLRDAVAATQRTAGRSWVYERRLDVVQTPLMGCVLAFWGATHGAPVSIEPAIF